MITLDQVRKKYYHIYDFAKFGLEVPADFDTSSFELGRASNNKILKEKWNKFIQDKNNLSDESAR